MTSSLQSTTGTFTYPTPSPYPPFCGDAFWINYVPVMVTENKGMQAFKIAQALVDQGLAKADTSREFITLMSTIIKLLHEGGE